MEKFGNRDGLIFGLVPIMIHPEVLFHMEFGGAAASGKPAMLSSAEIVDAVDRALRDRRSDPPDKAPAWQIRHGKPSARDILVVSNGEGRLRTREDVRAALDHPRMPKLSPPWQNH